MEWMNRGQRAPQPQSNNQPAPHGPGVPSGGHPAHSQPNKGFGGDGQDKMKYAMVALLFSGTILIVALLIFIGLGGKGEGRYVKDDKLQAVFLNGGQVYFGRIRSLNKDHLRLTDIYYLRVNQQVQPDQQGAAGAGASDDISLVKLGCELHGPEDAMVINRDQVVFWENLKEDAQVSQAVVEYIQQNPEGQDCNDSQAQPQGEQGNGAEQEATPDPAANPGNQENNEQ